MDLRIRTFGDPVLREMGRDVESIDSETKQLINDMFDTLRAEPGRVGLAAPQVGVSRRLFVYDLGYGPRCLINPRIIKGEGEQSGEEGCLSFPGIYIEVTRSRRVRASCLTPSGHNIVVEAEDFPARVIQHETDHLDGVLMIDRCDGEERARALDEYGDIELRKTISNT